MQITGTLFGLALLPLCAAGQTAAPAAPAVSTTVVVLGSFDPISEGESARSVEVLETQKERLAFPTLQDYLRMDSSVVLQQRGGGGTQADVSLRGTTFEQTLVLLNGFRMNDVETSHFNLDVPVPLDALGAIDVLHGAGSTLYGSDAIGGVVDVLTYRPTVSSLQLRTGWSSFGGQQEAFVASGVWARWSEVLAGGRDKSDGFTVDRDYSSRQLSSETRIATRLGESDVLLAVSDRPFGANLFYGPYNSFERTKGWFAGLHQQLGTQTSASVAYRRHTDEFDLFRGVPTPYDNNHIDQNWEGTLRRADRIAKNLRLFYGLEEDTDQIRSNSLGNHGRNRGAGYVQAELRVPGRGSVSVGAREEVLSGGHAEFSPSAAASFWLPRSVKLRASAGHGFRLPTFVDLYYSDPTHAPNEALVPETAWNFDGGADWYSRANTTAAVTFFYNRLQNTIDYTRAVNAPTGTPYTATNLESLRYLGVEASLTMQLRRRQQVRLAYTGVSGAQPSLDGLTSVYVANYAVNNASFEYRKTLARPDVLVRTRVGVEQHVGQTAYPVWDVEAARQHGWIRPYVQIANLSNTNYAEILRPSAVPMPPRSFMGGVEFELHRHHHN
ncbi:MAG TPA: TonB-dependent receptor [Acidobacteriaceae bacterium]